VKRIKNRCLISNKIIEGKEVVLIDYAIDYVLKQGYEIYKIEDKRR